MEKKKVKPVFGSFECSDTVDGITIKFLTDVNRFRIEPHEGLSSPIVITEEELNAIAKFTKGFRISKFYTQEELDKAREEGREEIRQLLRDKKQIQKFLKENPRFYKGKKIETPSVATLTKFEQQGNMNKLQKDLTILNIAVGVALLTLFVMGILIVTVLI